MLRAQRAENFWSVYPQLGHILGGGTAQNKEDGRLCVSVLCLPRLQTADCGCGLQKVKTMQSAVMKKFLHRYTLKVLRQSIQNKQLKKYKPKLSYI